MSSEVPAAARIVADALRADEFGGDYAKSLSLATELDKLSERHIPLRDGRYHRPDEIPLIDEWKARVALVRRTVEALALRPVPHFGGDLIVHHLSEARLQIGHLESYIDSAKRTEEERKG